MKHKKPIQGILTLNAMFVIGLAVYLIFTAPVDVLDLMVNVIFWGLMIASVVTVILGTGGVLWNLIGVLLDWIERYREGLLNG